MADIDELIRQNALKEDAVASSAGVEPSGGLLSRIGNFIGGSDKTDTLDASGLTQADRRQSLFAGLTDIGAKLMAAGEPMYGAQRAGILASMGSVPANMAQMRSTIAQQKLLGIKGAQAQREMQVQREMDAAAKDPNHPMWSQFQGQDKALAQWAMRTGGFKAYLEFLAHKDDAAYKRAMAIKAMAEGRKADAEAAGMTASDASTKAMFGSDGSAAPPPAAPAPAAPAPAAPAPPGPRADASDPAAIAGMSADAGPVLNPQMQTLAANQPPTVAPPSDGSAQPTQSAQAILQGMQQAGPGGGAQVVEGPTATPTVPTPTAPAAPAAGQPRTFAPGYNGPRTLQEVARALPPAEQKAIMGLWPPQKRIDALEKHLDRQIDYHKIAVEAINKHMYPGPDGKPVVNKELAEAEYLAKKREYEAQADAQQRDRELTIREQQALAAKQNADTQQRAQAVTATEKGQTTEGQYSPQILQQQQEEKKQEAQMKADIDLRSEFAKTDYKAYGDPDKGPLAVVRGANKMLPLIYEAEHYRKQGMLTGSFPETRMMLNRMRSTMGLTGDVSQDQINRTGYNNVVGRMMIEGLSAGRPLGSQVSDADREAMKELTGLGSYGDKEIAKLMDIAERTAMRAHENFQDTVSSLSRKHPSLKNILAVDADIKPVDRDTWTQNFQNQQEERRKRENPLKKEF